MRSRDRGMLERAWNMGAKLDTLLYRELQAQRGPTLLPKGERDEAILDMIPVIRRALKKYERLLGAPLPRLPRKP